MCEHLHCLPSPGGLFDQDCWIVAGIDMVVEAQDMKRRIEQHNVDRKRATAGR